MNKIKSYIYTPAYHKQIKWFWLSFLIGLLLLSLLILFVAMGWAGNLPKVEELENPKTNLATEVISEDGVVLGKYYIENRSNETYKTIGPNLINALIATEDIRFNKHSGIDFQGLGTGFVANMIGKKRGASTITQQLAKNLFKRDDFSNVFKKTLTKLKEWVLAIQLEKRYTKEEIITMYLNTVQFSGNAFGIRSAAKVFFNKKPSDLQVQEAATLVGILKAIGRFNPVKNPENSLNRRNTVLGQMAKYDYIKKEEFEKLKQLPLAVEFSQDDHTDGLATHFREYLRGEISDWAEKNGLDIYKDGLKIYTTINSKMQHYAEESMVEHLKEIQKVFNREWRGRRPPDLDKLCKENMVRTDRYKRLKHAKANDKDIMHEFETKVKTKVWTYTGMRDTLISPLDSIGYYKMMLQSGFMAMDPHNGQIRAWVGGQNYNYFKYDHVNLKATRQVGSTFKPFVYSLAVDNNFSPCTKIPNQPVVFEEFDNWSPKNSDGTTSGRDLTMYQGLAGSVNNIVAYLLKQLGPNGPQTVIDLARKMGIKGKLEPYPSICLGVFDLSVYEMVGAFSTFANKGLWVKPQYISKITDKAGNVLYTPQMETQEAMSEQTAYIMCRILEGVTSHGTGWEIKNKYKIKGATGGKTGTTQNNTDGWFMGITPNLTAGCWTGCEDMGVHFQSTANGSGATMSLPIWGLFFQKVQADPTLKIEFPDMFEPPKKKMTIEIDCAKYTGDGDGTPIDFNNIGGE